MIDRWIENAVTEFGTTLGIADLTFNSNGNVQLQFETSGELTIEPADDHVRVFLVRQHSFIKHSQLEHALHLCHWQHGTPFTTQAGLLRDDRLMFVVGIANTEFVTAALQRVFEYLCGLHESVAATP